MKRFKAGDLAITCNSRVPLLNDNLLVWIVKVKGPMPRFGLRFCYLIERVDGQPFALVRAPGALAPERGGLRTLAAQHQLRPLRDRLADTAVRRTEKAIA
jgi:hypothetical protein